MSNTNTVYFFDGPGGAIELNGCNPMDNEKFTAKFGGVLALRYDSFSRMVGYAGNWTLGSVMPITRRISYKSNPSLHECGAKCRSGKPGGVCECSCGGKNHGVSHK